MNVDIVVVGSGAGGMTAATVAALKGQKVLLVEATEFFGGTTAYSGGGVWVPKNHHQPEVGIEDELEQAETYVKSILGDEYDEDLQRAYIHTAAEMLRFMEDNTEVKLTGTTIPDYEPAQPGWNISRCLLTVQYDGNKLGSLLGKLRKPIPEMGLFGSMQLDPADVFQMKSCFKSLAAFTATARCFLRFFFQKLVYRRGTRLCNGNALAGRLLKSANDAGVVLWNRSRAKDLVIENGRVTGLVIEKDGVEIKVASNKGVVLASGGFGANPEMRAKYLPQTATGYNLQPEGNVGDGINMGVKAGAAFITDNSANGIWVPASRCQRKDGTTATFPSLFFDRHCPGSIMVDARTGKRFLNEGFHYQSFGETCAKLGVEKIWMIADAEFVGKYGMGMAKPKPFPLKPWIDKGYLIKADTIEELAEKLDVDPDVLKETVATFNKDAAQGKDSEFKRGDDYYSAYMGDPDHQPNPGVAPLNKAPYYALDVRPSDLCTLAGLSINNHAQVLTDEGTVIEGLYAAGIDANTVMRGYYPGGGTSLGPAMTFGYIAAMHLAGNT